MNIGANSTLQRLRVQHNPNTNFLRAPSSSTIRSPLNVQQPQEWIPPVSTLISTGRNRPSAEEPFTIPPNNQEPDYLFENEEFSVVSEMIEKEELMSKKELKKLEKKKIGKSCSQCTVCHEKYQKGEVIRILPCEHFFHYKCLKPWFKKSNACPLCRLNIKQVLQQKLGCPLVSGSLDDLDDDL
jgi:hypothetical protein